MNRKDASIPSGWSMGNAKEKMLSGPVGKVFGFYFKYKENQWK